MGIDLELAIAFMESHPSEAALSIERMPYEDAVALLSEAPVGIAAAVIVAMAPYFAAECVQSLPLDKAGEVIGSMARDQSALLLRRMKSEERSRLLHAAPPEASLRLALLLRFPESTAGALMDPEVLSLPADLGVGEAIDRIRRSGARVFHYVYVVNRERKLVGVASLRELIEGAAEKLLSDVMHRDVARLSVHSDLLAMRAHPGWREYYALPVVDDQGLLVGGIRLKTLHAAAGEETDALATNASPMAASLALGELYWSTLGSFLETLWPVANSNRVEQLENDHERPSDPRRTGSDQPLSG